LALGNQGGHLGAALIAQGGDAGHVEPGADPDRAAALGEQERAIEQGNDALRHILPLGGGDRVGVSARRLGDDGHLRGGEIGIGGGQVAACRLHAATQAAEQVELIADVQANIDGQVRAVRAGRSLALRRPAILRARAHRRLRAALGTDLAQRRTGAVQPGNGDAQVGICRKRIGDKAVEHRIPIHAPPIALDGRDDHAGRVGRDKRAGRSLGRRRHGIIRAGGAGRQSECGNSSKKKADHDSSYSAGCSAGAGPSAREARPNRSPSARQTT
jgi:hypothetical protein